MYIYINVYTYQHLYLYIFISLLATTSWIALTAMRAREVGAPLDIFVFIHVYLSNSYRLNWTCHARARTGGHLWHMYIYIHTYLDIYIYTYKQLRLELPHSHARARADLGAPLAYICIHAYIFIYICIYTSNCLLNCLTATRVRELGSTFDVIMYTYIYTYILICIL